MTTTPEARALADDLVVLANARETPAPVGRVYRRAAAAIRDLTTALAAAEADAAAAREDCADCLRLLGRIARDGRCNFSEVRQLVNRAVLARQEDRT